ncbi:MAG: 6,7-dimethyl-8-ribityllumazine synthase [Actinobacteria bacterium]|nr:6,7-dimethyl-8-ribityllumazine synthase [Actinomycetota bacterium]
MATLIEPELRGAGLRVGVAVARFNELFTKHLLEGCLRELRRHGVADADITIAWVPGSFELATAARELVEQRHVAVAVCLGCIIRGETTHYDHVAQESARSIARVALETRTPVIYGVVTAETVEQAINRCGAKAGNKGADAGVAAVEMGRLVQTLRTHPARGHRARKASERPAAASPPTS